MLLLLLLLPLPLFCNVEEGAGNAKAEVAALAAAKGRAPRHVFAATGGAAVAGARFVEEKLFSSDGAMAESQLRAMRNIMQ